MGDEESLLDRDTYSVSVRYFGEIGVEDDGGCVGKVICIGKYQHD